LKRNIREKGPKNSIKKRRACHTQIRRLFVFIAKLFSFDSANGAAVFTSAAIYAVAVDYVNTLCFVQNNRTNGASVCASAASQAFIRNYMCHNRYLQDIFDFFYGYYSIFFLISKGL
jgi:hypothetical protein